MNPGAIQGGVTVMGGYPPTSISLWLYMLAIGDGVPVC